MNSTPTTRVTTQRTIHTEAEMYAATQAFLDGPWAKLVAAKNAVHEAVVTTIYADNGSHDTTLWQDIQPCRAGLSAEESMEMLTGYASLQHELGNPVTTMMNSYFGNSQIPEAKISFAERLKQLCAGFAMHSELATLSDALAQQTGALQKNAAGHVTYRESKTEALWRSANDVEAWTNANADKIPDEDKQTIANNLAAYREALPQVLAFVDVARAYTKPIVENELQEQIRVLNRPLHSWARHEPGALTQLLDAKQKILTHVPHEPKALLKDAARLRTATDFLYHYVHSTSAPTLDFNTRMMRVVAAGEVLKTGEKTLDSIKELQLEKTEDIRRYEEALPEILAFAAQAEKYLAIYAPDKLAAAKQPLAHSGRSM